VGVNNLTRPGARHLGEDYRCHSDAENLTTEQALKLGGTIQPPRTPQPTAGLVENYFGSEKLKTAKVEAEILAKKFSDMGALFGVEWNREEIRYGEKGIESIRYSGKYNLSTFPESQVTFVIDFVEKDGAMESNFELFFIQESMQGQGFAKDLMKEYLDSLQRQGIYKVNIYANKDVGGYAWAKFGFTANSRDEVEHLLFLYGDRLSKSELLDVEKILDAFYSNRMDSEPFPMNILADKPYGKKLLLDSGWNGNLDLRNKKQLKRVYDYMEGNL
jgi:GNAT superfamily N-acetyltransferase